MHFLNDPNSGNVHSESNENSYSQKETSLILILVNKHLVEEKGFEKVNNNIKKIITHFKVYDKFFISI